MASMKSSAGLVAGLFDGLHEWSSDGSSSLVQVGGKAALVAHGGGQAAWLSGLAARVWNTSAHQRRASSATLGAPTGMIMNSWMSTVLAACAPPFRMFIMGTGRRLAVHAAQDSVYRGSLQRLRRQRLAQAMETAQNGVCAQIGFVLGAVQLGAWRHRWRS